MQRTNKTSAIYPQLIASKDSLTPIHRYGLLRADSGTINVSRALLECLLIQGEEHGKKKAGIFL